MANNINIAELDFDLIKANLKTFLKSQSQFNSYDFEGSSMSVLLDILAYNTHYKALYDNLAINEVFLDSASKRSSIVSRARDLGYLPTSAKSPTATVSIRITNSTLPITQQILTLPAYSVLYTTVNNISYQYNTTNDISVIRLVNGDFYFPTVNIIEGSLLTNTYNYTLGSKIIIPNRDCDISTLVVKVQDPITNLYINYSQAQKLYTIKSDSTVYFTREIDNGLYEIQFGNGIIGKALLQNQNVIIQYIVTNKAITNGAKLFQYQGIIGSGTTSVTTISSAFGGSEPEDKESIRFNAPRFYAAQDRAVTAGDYSALLTKLFPNIESAQIWGGEDNIPPVYGRTFISVKPIGSNVLTISDKDYISTTLLGQKTVLGIKPIFVDPDFLYIALNTTVYYTPKNTSKSSGDIKTIVIQTIKDYNTKNLGKFNKIFKFSNYTKSIDSSDVSVTSNITSLILHRPVNVLYNINAKYTVNIANPIYQTIVAQDSILSTGFYIPFDTNVYYIVDDGIGNLKTFYLKPDKSRVYSVLNIGTVNYNLGILYINGLNIVSLATSDFRFFIKPSSNDVISVRNNLVIIPDELINVNVIVDGLSGGDNAGGSNYIFTNSRA